MEGQSPLQGNFPGEFSTGAQARGGPSLQVGWVAMSADMELGGSSRLMIGLKIVS